MEAMILRLLILYKILTVILCSNKEFVVNSMVAARDRSEEYYFCAYGVAVSKEQNNKYLPFYYKSDWDGCNLNSLDNVTVAGRIVMLRSGSCSVKTKIENIQNLKAAGLIIITTANITAKSSSISVRIPIASISEADGAELMKLAENIKLYVSIKSLKDEFSISSVFVWVTAVFSLTLGSVWAANSHLQFMTYERLASETSLNAATESKESNFRHKKPTCLEDVTCLLCWVVIMCVSIFLLFMFYSILVYIAIIVYCLSSTIALYWFGCRIMKQIPFGNCRFPRIKMSDGYYFHAKVRTMLWVSFCISVMIIWAICRNYSYSWVLQDLLGVSFCIFAINTITPSDLQIIFYLSIVFVFYDILFALISPFITKSGKSIMLYIATEDEDTELEQLPMYIKFPHFGEFPFHKCLKDKYDLIGLGDIVIPGFIVAYTASFDLEYHGEYIYLIVSVIAYSFGLVIAAIAKNKLGLGEPSLVYLIPITLIASLIVAAARRELKSIWFGKSPMTPERESRGIEVRA